MHRQRASQLTRLFPFKKRKLDDAISNLDSAMASSSHDAPETSPSKRPNTSRTSSIYASLSKYKIFRSSSASKATTRTISSPYALASKPPYRPESSEDFLARLATFKITTYRDKPPEIDAVAAAKAGWVNDGKERLVCGYCTSSWVLATTSGMTSRDAATTLVEKQRVGLVSNHKDFCPWKKAQCDGEFFPNLHVPRTSRVKHATGPEERTVSLTLLSHTCLRLHFRFGLSHTAQGTISSGEGDKISSGRSYAISDWPTREAPFGKEHHPSNRARAPAALAHVHAFCFLKSDIKGSVVLDGNS